MAVDTTISGISSADACGQKNDIFLFMTRLEELIDNGFFQIEDLIHRRSFGYGYFIFKTVDHNHGIFFANPCDLQSIKAGVFQVSAEMAAKIRYTRNVRQR